MKFFFPVLALLALTLGTSCGPDTVSVERNTAYGTADGHHQRPTRRVEH